MTRRPRTVLAMAEHLPARLFADPTLTRLRTAAEVDTGLVLHDYTSPAARAALADAEVLFTCWGAPRIDESMLDATPSLRAIIHAAGSVKGLIAPVCWERGVVVSSGADANAVPVAEYTLAMILLAGKDVLGSARAYHRTGDRPPRPEGIGNFGKRIGIVSASKVGRRVIELLRPFDLDIVLFDPFVDEADAAALGVTQAGLDELCASCDVISLHAPSIPSTRHLIGPAQIAAMPVGSTLINTSRGSVVDHDALLTRLRTGEISAVLDVTEPEPVPAGSPFLELPNVVLTPHVAGAQGREILRLGESAVAELERFARGEAFAHGVLAEQLEYIA